MKIEKLRKSIKANKYEISLHAQRERYQEDITISDIEDAVCNGEIIETYPGDPRGKSYLVLGYSHQRPIHIVCGILHRGWIRIITVYIPEKPKWTNFRHRRRHT